jgi:HAD superfamily hydrolase (TIGR01509 family)
MLQPVTLAAVLFDLDGTLVDSEGANVESVVRAAGRVKVELDSEDRRFIVGHSWNEIYARLRGRHGMDVPMPELVAWAIEEKALLLRQTPYVPLPGAVAAVRRLGRRSALAVVSGASRFEVKDAVASLGLTAEFRVLLGAEDYRRGKPDPEPFVLASQLLGVSPRDCLVIEDAEPGILSGRAAGAKVVAVQAGNVSGFDLSAADVVVSTLDEVTDELCDRLFLG